MATETMDTKAALARSAASWPYGLLGAEAPSRAAVTAAAPHDPAAGAGHRSVVAAAEARNQFATTRAIDRDHLLDRLQHLRGILPVFAQELASSRRQAAALRVENRGLLEEVRRLRAERGQDVSRGRQGARAQRRQG